MSVLGLLEGQRLKYRLGNPLVNPADWHPQGSAVHNTAVYTTDWPLLFSQDPAGARARYLEANAEMMDPEMWPTLDAFFAANGITFQPDPPVVNPTTPVAPVAPVAPVVPIVPAFPDAQAAIQNEIDTIVNTFDAADANGKLVMIQRLRQLGPEGVSIANTFDRASLRDQVTGPAFQPDPAPMPDGGGRAGAVEVANSANDAQGGRAPDGTTIEGGAVQPKSLVLPIAAAIAAWLFVKG